VVIGLIDNSIFGRQNQSLFRTQPIDQQVRWFIQSRNNKQVVQLSYLRLKKVRKSVINKEENELYQ